MFKKFYLTLRWAANHPVNHGSKAKAILNFIRAQIGARMVLGDVCVPFPNETRLLIPPSMKGATHFIWPGLVDFEEMSFVMHFLRPEDLFVDVGANIGAFTVMASAVAGARTIAYEQAPFAFGYLERNTWLNKLSERVVVRAIALGATEGKIHFTAGLGTENHISEGDSGEERIEVQLSTLDAQLAGLEPTVIKIDVEGFESDVLAGAKGVLAKPSLQALILERVGNASRFGRDESNLHKYVHNLGFNPYGYGPKSRELHPIDGELAHGNVIYVRNSEMAAERLRLAPAYRFADRSI